MKYIKGDLIKLFKQGNFDIIGHQCNCVGVMGAGIAKSLAQEFPKINVEVNGTLQAVSLFGIVEIFGSEYGLIANMYSQFRTGTCRKEGIDSFEVRLGALKTCLRQINEGFKGQTIGLPLISSGFAADLDKKGQMTDLEYFDKYISDTVKIHLSDLDVTIVYL